MDEKEQLAYMENSMPQDFCENEGDAHFQRWIYTMRREMQEILPGVWLGPYASAMKRNEGQLNQVGITHIVLIRGPNEAYFIRPHFPERIYLTMEISDKPSQNIIQYFRKVCQFIDDCLSQGGRVLVHGISGISRSASLIIAYVMTKKRLNFDEAYRFVQQRRFCIHPNESFKRQLAEFEPIYQAQMTNQPCLYQNRELKRPFEEEVEQPM